jgi:hypothetical protein
MPPIRGTNEVGLCPARRQMSQSLIFTSANVPAADVFFRILGGVVGLRFEHRIAIVRGSSRLDQIASKAINNGASMSVFRRVNSNRAERRPAIMQM